MAKKKSTVDCNSVEKQYNEGFFFFFKYNYIRQIHWLQKSRITFNSEPIHSDRLH